MSCITCANRLVPQSDNRDSGTSNIGTISSARSQAILIAFWSGVGNTKGSRALLVVGGRGRRGERMVSP